MSEKGDGCRPNDFNCNPQCGDVFGVKTGRGDVKYRTRIGTCEVALLGATSRTHVTRTLGKDYVSKDWAEMPGVCRSRTQLAMLQSSLI
ncbi:hypothetical protein AGR8A_pTi20151 [Agrobacterium fabrum str. J-07]|nr:hypothetical protein AGR8A_pTi20151 [Agrobacterium fabrum str. J-07]